METENSIYGPYSRRKLHIRKFFPNGRVMAVWWNREDVEQMMFCDSLDHAREMASQLGLSGILL